MPENGVPRKSLSFFRSSNRAVDNASQSSTKIRALGRAVSMVNASKNATRSSSESQEGDSEASTFESPTQRLSFRVLNPDPHTSTSSSTDSSRINNDSAYDNEEEEEEDEIVEEIHYKQDEEEIHLQEKTMVSEDEMTKEEPTTTTTPAPPPTPLHALSTPPTTESSSSSPDMKKTQGDIVGGTTRYSQGWKIIGSTPEEDEQLQQPYQRHSKVMELEESLPPTPQLTTNRPRVSFDTMHNSSDGGSSASPLSPTSPTMLPMYPQQQQSPVIYQDPRRLRHPPRTTRSRPMAFIQQQQQQHLPLPPRQSFTSTYGHFISSSSSSLISPRLTNTTARKIQHPITQSKYAKASYSLTNHPDAIKTYRSMAEKTRDPIVQLSYAKYLLEIADLYDGQQHTSNDATCSSTSVSSSTSQRLSLDGYDPATSRTSLDTIRSAPSLSTTTPTHRLSDASRRKKKMLQDEGVRWIKLLAKKNVGEAAYLQARWLDRGEYGFSKNPSKAFKLYKVAAAEFVPEAMYQVGKAYERSGNTMQALSNYQGAAEKDIVQAIYRMARIHLLGELGQRRNTFLGLELLTQAVDRATEQCPEPPYLLGLILTGAYPKVELSTELIHRYGGELAALRHIEHAAQLGYGPAQSRIAYIYEHGLYGAPMHFAKSFGYYDMAAREYNSPQAMLGLSRLYNRGCRGPADILTEEERLARDVSEWLSATTRNEDAAFRWCEKAADQGLDEAVFLLGWYYETGVGVLRDYERAKQLYQKAANKGHQGAVERLQKANSMTRQQHESTKRNIRTSSCVLM